MARSKSSEFRLYALIKKRLSEMGWCVKRPDSGGSVYEQNEVFSDPALKQALGRDRPESVVVLENSRYWVIEAKANAAHLERALEQAQSYAGKINVTSGISCPIVTGIAGDADSTYYVKTQCLVKREWKTLSINNRQATGFLSREQIERALAGGKANLDEYEIDDRLFVSKIQEVNKILHGGAISQKNRAQVLACILLALANDPQMRLHDDPTTMIRDINSRAEMELQKHKKANFYGEIAINAPTSTDNHIKNRNALARSINILQGLNITSAINSGRDVLGQCYEQFLKYANDAKEIGIVLTPRTITNFAADVIGVEATDRIFDPTCGTGGFLVAALDKVRKGRGDIDEFKKGNLYGVEQDALIATLAIVNMVFRGDGSSNIVEGDCLKKKYTNMDKVLMNPPFALETEYEWQFVDRALSAMRPEGLLFAIVPTSVMNSAQEGRGEETWRKQMMERNTLLSVIKMPEDLFYPHASKGTYGVVLRAHVPHNVSKDTVIWAVLDDGVARTKTSPAKQSNMPKIAKAIKKHIARGAKPEYAPGEIDCSLLIPDNWDFSPELYIGRGRESGEFDLPKIMRNMREGELVLQGSKQKGRILGNCAEFPLVSFFEGWERGKSGRNKGLGRGDLPLISTSEMANGISAMVDRKDVEKIYDAGGITISANGGSCYAHYHGYQFAANADVYVCRPRDDLDEDCCLFLCAAINGETWRYNYFRKFSQPQFNNLRIKIPVKNGKVDYDKMRKIACDARG